MIVDMHVHVGGDEPILYKRRMAHVPASDWARWWIGENHFDRIAEASGQPMATLYKVARFLGRFGLDMANNERQVLTINQAKHVDAVAVLAMAPVIDPSGYLSVENTPLYTSNQAVLDIAKKSDRIIPCFSLNPIDLGAVSQLNKLVSSLGDRPRMLKLLPSIQGWHADGVDWKGQTLPYQERLIAFYKELSDLDVVTLVHTGIEEVVDPTDEQFRQHGGDIAKYRLLVDSGVTVIFAHAGYDMSYWPEFATQHHQAREVAQSLYSCKNTFADTSGALSDYTFLGSLGVDFFPSHLEKMVYGSDLPGVALAPPRRVLKKLAAIPGLGNPYLDFMFEAFTRMEGDSELCRTKNVFDQHKLMMGHSLDVLVGKEIITPQDKTDFFERGAKLLKFGK